MTNSARRFSAPRTATLAGTLTAILALLTACTQPSDCVVGYRGNCLSGPTPAAQPASPPPPVVTAPQPVVVTPPAQPALLAPAAAAPKPAVPLGDPATFADIDDKQCRSYGLKFGTHDYADCRIRLSAQHRGLDPNIGAASPPR